MSTLAPTIQPASSLRRLIARHPVAAFLAMAYAMYFAFALPPVRTYLDIFLDQPLWSVLGTLFSATLPAFLVVAALNGWAGVRDLARRSLRWRVGARWYLIALLGLPIAVLLTASVIYGLAPLNALLNKWPLLFTVMLPDLLLRIVFFNLAEEIGWTGFLQARLQDTHGPFKASIMVTIPFALWHVPDVMIEFGLTPLELDFYLLLGAFAIAQLLGRVVIMWLYNNTNRSVLLVGLFHSSHNTTVNRMTSAFIPGSAESGFFIVSGVLAVAALLMIVFTKGRLSYQSTPPQT